MGHFEWPIAKNILNLNSPLPLPKKRKWHVSTLFYMDVENHISVIVLHLHVLCSTFIITWMLINLIMWQNKINFIMTFTLSVSPKPYTNTAKNQQDWFNLRQYQPHTNNLVLRTWGKTNIIPGPYQSPY
jgi:hypothetical protein